LDADLVQDFSTGALARVQDVEESRLREKRARNLFKKLFHHNITRTLRILGYLPSQSDERKFLHSNYKAHLLERARDGGPFEASSPARKQLPSFNQPRGSPDQYLKELQKEVYSMGQGSLPRLQNTVALLRAEMEGFVKEMRPAL
jgi:hypothetical protein